MTGLELTDIYRQLTTASEFSQQVVIMCGVISAIPLLLLVPIHTHLPKTLTYSPARALGLCSAAATLSLTNLWFGWGWHVGMGLADTFGINGGDYAPTKIFMPLALMLLFLSALYFTLKPLQSHRPTSAGRRNSRIKAPDYNLRGKMEGTLPTHRYQEV